MHVNNIDNSDEIASHMLAAYPMEGCGYIQNNTFYPVQNVADDPINSFSFPQGLTEILIDKAEPYSIIHSHTTRSGKYDLRCPTKLDMAGQQRTEVPWGIVHCDGIGISSILWFGPPQDTTLVGREYLPNINDCFTICRDYYWQNYKLQFPSYPREIDWTTKDPGMLIEHLPTSTGWVALAKGTNIEVGDLVLFRIASQYPNHLGVIITDTNFIHHLADRLSMEDPIIKWKQFIFKVLRYSVLRTVLLT
ncbi:MAG: NlpC/P60 family protein [Burkholderiales bacterium]